MTLSWLVEFVGLALLYALVVTLLGLSLARCTGWVNSWRLAPLLLVTLFFVFLTQHPFPVPDELKCPMPSATPQLRPFNFWDTIITLYQSKTGAIDWLANKTIVATAMNFIVCAVIGATMARHTLRILSAAMFGITLTITVELTQLTGFWGIYPCAYRQFNVDDLMFNFLGVISGFIILRARLYMIMGTQRHN